MFVCEHILSYCGVCRRTVFLNFKDVGIGIFVFDYPSPPPHTKRNIKDITTCACKQWWIYIVKFWTRASPPRSKFFQFHAVFGKIWQNRMLAPPGELAPPPRGNPGSATGKGSFILERKQKYFFL